MFKPATRKQIKLRMALCGPTGSGKTYTALRLAFAIGKKVAVIDTEHGKASVYQGENPDGTPWDWDEAVLSTFTPQAYIAAIIEAGKGGYDVLIIDSLSHAWAGPGGILEMKDNKGGNSFAAWKDLTPLHNKLIDTVLACPCHVISTMRSKMGYVLETDARGKQTPQKVGMEPIQRNDVEYEFDIVGDMNQANVLTVTKTRCSAINGAIVAQPGPGFILPVMDWLQSGTAAPPKPEAPPADTTTPVKKYLHKRFGCASIEDCELVMRYTLANPDLTWQQLQSGEINATTIEPRIETWLKQSDIDPTTVLASLKPEPEFVP